LDQGVGRSFDLIEADAFVFLCLRDDFLFRCHQSEPLRPALSDLTMLGPPEGAGLRRALVQPAMKCGYRFEDDELVEEMLAEVEGERGALPLLAFAMSRLWEKRERENGLLTRQAYHDIGGVGGALARHAEATIDRIGSGRLPIVRELFRNLVTAEGTRAVRELDDLLSVFSTSGVGAALTPVRDGRGEPRRPPRGDKPPGYDGNGNWEAAADILTEIEEAFAAAMTAHARRRKRRRRTAVAAAFVVLLAVLGVVGASRQ